ncbi:MAG: hypothetical protein HN867_18355 [Deltaproteobacteria bacterium]|nr:hypothetical protein [Deltaproteobacteria bacterium]
MTKADAFDRAVKLIFKNNDFTLFDEIYHPDYSAQDPTTGIIVNLEDEKLVLSTYSEDYILGLFRIVYESDDFLCLHRYVKGNKNSDPIYYAIIFMIKYKDGLILTQESVRESLDRDPSEGQNWNWEDYE